MSRTYSVSFHSITPGEGDDGDYEEESGYDAQDVDAEPDEYDIEDHGGESEAAVALMVKVLRNAGATEPSSSHFHAGIWYSTGDADVNYRTGEQTTHEYSFKGFSVIEQEAIFTLITRRRNNPAHTKLPPGWRVQVEGDKVVAYKSGRLFASRWRDEGWVGVLPPNYAFPPNSVVMAGNVLLTGSPFATDK